VVLLPARVPEGPAFRKRDRFSVREGDIIAGSILDVFARQLVEAGTLHPRFRPGRRLLDHSLRLFFEALTQLLALFAQCTLELSRLPVHLLVFFLLLRQSPRNQGEALDGRDVRHPADAAADAEVVTEASARVRLVRKW